MKVTRTALMTMAVTTGLATDLFAASAERVDSSSILIWAFLGMCALIVILQLMPAMMLVFGLVKAFFSKEPKEATVHTSAKG